MIDTIMIIAMCAILASGLIAAILFTFMQKGSQSFGEVAKDSQANIFGLSMRRLMYFCGALALALWAVLGLADLVSRFVGPSQ